MSNANQILIFDRKLVDYHRHRAAPDFSKHNILFEETANHLLDRLGDVKRDFQAVLCLDPHEGALTQHFETRSTPALAMRDFSADELLSCAPNDFDLAVSNLSLHWINDLPGALIQIRNALKSDGLFLAAMPGGQTLYELRTCLLDAELAITGGVSPRVSPVIELPTASALLQRAGFALPVTDGEIITLTYPDAFALMRDLRGMGETNAHRDRSRGFTRRAVLFEAAKLYRERYAGSDGRIPATFEILYLHGWKA